MELNKSNARTGLGYLLSAFICAMGARSIVDPINQSQAYGVPMTAATDKWQYVPVMGVRSLALGIAAGTLMLRGDRKAAGVVLSTAALIGPVDVWACWSAAGRMSSEAWGHVFGDGLFAVTGLWLAME